MAKEGHLISEPHGVLTPASVHAPPASLTLLPLSLSLSPLPTLRHMAARRRHPTAVPGGHGSVAAILLLMALILLISPRRALAQSPSSGTKDNNSTGGGGGGGGTNNSNYGNYFGAAKFNPSMAIVVVVLVTAFFFLGFFSIYLRNCGRAVDEGSIGIRFAGAAGVRSRRLQRQKGLQPEVLEMFPTMVYSEVKEHKVGKGALECAVCISEFEDDETLRLLPACNHIFHVDCIDAWLASHVTCPVCRFNLADVDAVANPVSVHAAEVGSPRPIPPDARIDVPGAGINVPAQPPERVTIVVEPITEAREEEDEQHRREEAMELAELGSWKRELRSRSGRRPPKFPRSHSTGHSLVNQAAGECVDKYTLRLPEHVLREILATKKFHRSASCVAFPTSEDGSSRPGYCAGGAGEGSSRGGRSVRGLGKSDRWPSFLMRTLSAKFPSWRRGGDVEGSVKKGELEGSTTKGRFAAVRTPFDCLGGGVGGAAGGSAKAEGRAASEEDESDTTAFARRV